MNRIFSRAGITVALVALVAGSAIAKPPAKGGEKMAAAPKCSSCHMTLSTKKTKDTPVAVKIKGKTYYCCAGCKMNAEKKPGKKG